MPRLFLGTLDSLFANIVRSFPAEFGLSGGFEILGEHEAEIVRSDVFRHVFESAADADQQDEFLEAFRLATLGSSEASVQRLLDNFISKHHHILLAAASPVLWGNEQRIWPQGNPWLRETPTTSPVSTPFSLFSKAKNSPKARPSSGKSSATNSPSLPGLRTRHPRQIFLGKIPRKLGRHRGR